MPWKEASAVQGRVSFVREYEMRLYSMSELCQSYGISRVTGYKWIARSRCGQSLEDRSRRPHRCPHRTPAELEGAIVAERVKHPTWGPDKLRVVLQRREPSVAWPSGTTMGTILCRHGLVESRRGRRRGRVPHEGGQLQTTAPNGAWASDFKGQFRLGDGGYCYPLTVTDHHSRFVLGCQGLTSTSHAGAQAVFERLFQAFGLPRVMLSDNGGPFACSQALAGLSRLSVWWLRLGILPVTIQPGHPEQNGRHERMHRTLKAETARPPGDDMAEQQNRFDRFRQQFNEERPHAALGQRPPATVYQPSPRPMPSTLPEPVYPGHYELRRVTHHGEFTWQGRRRFLSESLAGQTIGLEEIDDGLWSLHFGPLLIARYDQRTETLAGRSRSSWPAPVALRAPSAGQLEGAKV